MGFKWFQYKKCLILDDLGGPAFLETHTEQRIWALKSDEHS